MTGSGPVVPTPPAEVPQELVEVAARALHPAICRERCTPSVVQTLKAKAALSAVWPLVKAREQVLLNDIHRLWDEWERTDAERVRAARDEALEEAERRIAVWMNAPADFSDDYFAGCRKALSIVAELREATP